MPAVGPSQMPAEPATFRRILAAVRPSQMPAIQEPGRREDSLAALLKTLSRSLSRGTWKQARQRTLESTAATGFTPQANTTELARSYMVMGNIMLIDHKYDAAEAYFDRAVPVLKALPGYHKVQMKPMSGVPIQRSGSDRGRSIAIPMKSRQSSTIEPTAKDDRSTQAYPWTGHSHVERRLYIYIYVCTLHNPEEKIMRLLTTRQLHLGYQVIQRAFRGPNAA